MKLLTYEVNREDTMTYICKKHNVKVEEVVRLNATRYPGLKTNPFMVFYNWRLLLPLVNNGGSTQYDLYTGEVLQ